MDHDVGHLEVAQIKDTAQHLCVVLQNRALFRLEIDGAANLLMGCKDFGRVVGFGGRELEEEADDDLDRLRKRRQGRTATRISGETNKARRSANASA